MAGYVQTFSGADQAILDHTAFQPAIWLVRAAPGGQTIDPLWVNLRCGFTLPTDPNPNVPCIRRGDIEDFMERWIRGTHSSANFDGPFHGHYTNFEGTQSGDGKQSMVVGYRIFMLCVYTEPTCRVVVLSTTDVEQILNRCLDKYPHGPMPGCAGVSTRGDECVQWRVVPVPRPRLERMIDSTRDYIRRAVHRELDGQYTVIASLLIRRPTEEDMGRGTAWHRQVRRELAHEIDGILERLGVDSLAQGSARAYVSCVGRYGQYGIYRLEAAYLEARSRLEELGWPGPW